VSWVLATAGIAAAAISCSLALSSEGWDPELGEPLVLSMLAVWVTLSYVLGGLFAWRRRPDSAFGPLMIAAGFANFLSTLTWAPSDVPFTIGQSVDLLPPVVFLHVFLAFPDGRLRGRFERTLVATSYAVAFGLEVVRMNFGGFGPHNLLEIQSNPGTEEVVRKVQLSIVSVACLTGVLVLAARRVREGRPLRRSLTFVVDAFGLALVMVAFLFLSVVYGGPWVVQIRWLTFVTLGLAPAAFVAGLLSARLARSALGDLIVELRAELGPSALRDAFARALRDPSLTLAYWLPEFGSWADVEGRSVRLPEPGSERSVTLIDRDGARMAALLHDPGLEDEPELLAAVGAAAGIALENGRLQAEQGAHLEELRGSRSRVIEAGQRERQRLERNLHDGAQQRLIALSLELSLLEKQVAGDADAQRRLDRARREVAVTLEELRSVAHGLHPAVLSGHGLEVALQSIAAKAAVAVRLNVNLESRLPERIEVAAYYIVSESLANIAKHARAAAANIAVSRLDGVVLVEVADDGVGGADTERGSGLRGLADRVEALGGKLRVWSPPGGGTRLRAEMPCA